MSSQRSDLTDSVVLIGGGGHAAVVADAIGDRLLGHLAPVPGDQQWCGPWLGTDDQIEFLGQRGCRFAIGIGSIDRSSVAKRRRLIDQLPGDSLAVVVHPSASVAGSATLAAGVFVAAGAVVAARATVGSGSIVNTKSSIDHDCLIASNVHIAPGATLSGGVTVSDDVLIGVGSSVRHGISIGSGAIVGAGAAVVNDVDEDATVVGVPARRREL